MKEEVLQQVQKWLDDGAQLRASLVGERKVLADRLREIDTALAALPGDDAAVKGAIDIDAPKDASAPDIVRAILRRSPRGVTAAHIMAAARTVRAGISPVLIHSTLHRLKKAGTVDVQGKRGERRYRMRDTAAGE